MNRSAILAYKITRKSSIQTYLAARLLAVHLLMDDCLQA